MNRAIFVFSGAALLWLAMAAPVAAFTDNGDGTVTDPATGLMWDRCAWGQTGTNCSGGSASIHNWQAALGIAVTANAANEGAGHRGFNDWRLPNLTELESLVDITRAGPSIDTTAFPNTPSGLFWSSTVFTPRPAVAWYVAFDNGDTDADFQTFDGHVRLVRSGQSFDTLAAGVATQIAIQAGDGQTATAGTAVAISPSVIVLNTNDNPVADVAVSFAVASGGGSVTGEAATTNASGIATVGSWTLGATAGTNTLTASAAGLTGSPLTFTATGTAGVASQIAIQAGDGQTATAGTAVAIPPSVIVRDANDNPVAGVAVTFAVASGGGSVTGEAATTDASGIATVGSWTLGATVGSNTLTATANGLTGSSVTFTATATITPAVPIPTLGFWAVVLLTLLMLAMVLPAARRREGAVYKR